MFNQFRTMDHLQKCLLHKKWTQYYLWNGSDNSNSKREFKNMNYDNKVNNIIKQNCKLQNFKVKSTTPPILILSVENRSKLFNEQFLKSQHVTITPNKDGYRSTTLTLKFWNLLFCLIISLTLLNIIVDAFELSFAVWILTSVSHIRFMFIFLCN